MHSIENLFSVLLLLIRILLETIYSFGRFVYINRGMLFQLLLLYLVKLFIFIIIFSPVVLWYVSEVTTPCITSGEYLDVNNQPIERFQVMLSAWDKAKIIFNSSGKIKDIETGKTLNFRNNNYVISGECLSKN